tara:strand:- start:1834 stop:3591 length:1758 start_codon:yes stop_codon:yes gene_type:complete
MEIRMIPNNPKIRSLLLGSIGGLVGALVAALLFGAPTSLGSTAGFGLIVGALVGMCLGAGEFLLNGNTKKFVPAAAIALAIGAVGGGIGASFGQIAYQASSTQPAAGDGESAQNSGGIFSPETERRIREAGGAKGEIEISLSWEDYNDLDLIVREPNGNEIYFKEKISHVSGGKLDVDRNADCSEQKTNTPIEHIVWDRVDIPSGNYTIIVNFYDRCSGGGQSTPFTVEVKIGGSLQTFTGVASAVKDDYEMHTMSAPFSNVSSADDTSPTQSSSMGTMILLQIVGWAIFGVLLGVATGAPKKSVVATRNAAIGGLLGGIVGGILFVLIGKAMGGENPVVSLAIGMTTLGASIGLLIAVVEGALSAVLKITSGIYEGREMLIVHAAVTVGRDEVQDEYIGGDASIVRQHAEIQKHGNSHTITPLNGSVSVNSQPIGDAVQLNNGDIITLGKTNMMYRWRAASPGEENLDIPLLGPTTGDAPPPPPKPRTGGTEVPTQPPGPPSPPGTGEVRTPAPPPPKPRAGTAGTEVPTRPPRPAAPRGTGEVRTTAPPPPPGKTAIRPAAPKKRGDNGGKTTQPPPPPPARK